MLVCWRLIGSIILFNHPLDFLMKLLDQEMSLLHFYGEQRVLVHRLKIEIALTIISMMVEVYIC